MPVSLLLPWPATPVRLVWRLGYLRRLRAPEGPMELSQASLDQVKSLTPSLLTALGS